MLLQTAQGTGSVASSRCFPVGVRSRHVPFSAPLYHHHRAADAVPSGRVTATKERASQGEVERQVENVNRSYCDDFECTSSPAIEQTVKSLARCFERGHLRPEFFQRDCRVNDGFRSYEGATKVGEPSWLSTNITSRKAEVLRLQMLDKGSAQIDWRLRGNFSGAPVVITLKSVAEFNLLTGRVTTYVESWDLSQCSPLTALLMVVSRVTWSLQKRVQDAGGKVADAASSISGTLSSQDDDVYSNPADPTRMFQGGQQNQMQSDYIAGAFLVALVWLAFRAFSELEKLS